MGSSHSSPHTITIQPTPHPPTHPLTHPPTMDIEHEPHEEKEAPPAPDGAPAPDEPAAPVVVDPLLPDDEIAAALDAPPPPVVSPGTVPPEKIRETLIMLGFDERMSKNVDRRARALGIHGTLDWMFLPTDLQDIVIPLAMVRAIRAAQFRMPRGEASMFARARADLFCMGMNRLPLGRPVIPGGALFTPPPAGGVPHDPYGPIAADVPGSFEEATRLLDMRPVEALREIARMFYVYPWFSTPTGLEYVTQALEYLHPRLFPGAMLEPDTFVMHYHGPFLPAVGGPWAIGRTPAPAALTVNPLVVLSHMPNPCGLYRDFGGRLQPYIIPTTDVVIEPGAIVRLHLSPVERVVFLLQARYVAFTGVDAVVRSIRSFGVSPAIQALRDTDRGVIARLLERAMSSNDSRDFSWLRAFPACLYPVLHSFFVQRVIPKMDKRKLLFAVLASVDAAHVADMRAYIRSVCESTPRYKARGAIPHTKVLTLFDYYRRASISIPSCVTLQASSLCGAAHGAGELAARVDPEVAAMVASMPAMAADTASVHSGTGAGACRDIEDAGSSDGCRTCTNVLARLTRGRGCLLQRAGGGGARPVLRVTHPSAYITRASAAAVAVAPRTDGVITCVAR